MHPGSSRLYFSLRRCLPDADQAGGNRRGYSKPRFSGGQGSDPANLDPGHWNWGQCAVGITPSSNIAWKPLPGSAAVGPIVRYIDYDSGDSCRSKPRASMEAPSLGFSIEPRRAKEAHGPSHLCLQSASGTAYRGELCPHESGTVSEPIRLTSDPSWGTGEAEIAGSIVTGWTKGAGPVPTSPRCRAQWPARISCLPRSLWVVDKSGVTRIRSARLPHWKMSDPEDTQKRMVAAAAAAVVENDCHRLTAHINGHDAHIAIDEAHAPCRRKLMSVPSSVRIRLHDGHALSIAGWWRGSILQTSGLMLQGRLWLGNSEHVTVRGAADAPRGSAPVP